MCGEKAVFFDAGVGLCLSLSELRDFVYLLFPNHSMQHGSVRGQGCLALSPQESGATTSPSSISAQKQTLNR